MAKKAVASLQKGEGRGHAKVIKMVKSPKTGAYVFQEEMVINEKVKEYFSDIVKGKVVRYELDNLWALNFVMYDALGGGGSRSLAIDKSIILFS